MKPVLSICIPVYNCANFLGAALDSITRQFPENIEVIVFDGGSTDHTTALMERYSQQYPYISYFRADSRGGIDQDMAICVSKAHADYCWLFSGDDVMRPDALSRVLVDIRSDHDVYIYEHTICNIDMVYLHDHQVLSTGDPVEADLKVPQQRLEWFSKAATSEAFFSFMSGLVVRKASWDSGRLIPQFKGSCWAHVARFFEIAQQGLKVKFIPGILLDQRGDNDSFLERGIVNRFRISIEGYHQIANHFFGESSEEAFHVRRVIRHEFKLQSFMSAKIQCIRHPERESLQQLTQLIKLAYKDKSIKNWLAIKAYQLFPYSFFVIARFFYRALKKWRLMYVR